MDSTERDRDETTAPPAMTEDGVALHNDYPVNHRLRAEALADAGETTDPDALISDELIAATKDRLDRERAEAERLAEAAAKAPPAVSERMKIETLTRIAEEEGVQIGTDADRPAIVAAIEADRLAKKDS
jgi:hypothetical protein